MATIPELTIAPRGTPLPPLPDPSHEGVEVWRERDGSVCALGHVERADERWFRLFGVASFRFGSTGAVVAFVDEGRDLEQVRDAYFRSVLPLVLQSRGLEVLHASAVRAPHGVVALCAAKETGKSTLAYALSRRGHPLWADDAVVVDTSTAPVRAHQLPFGIRLRPASAAYFARDGSAAAGEGDSRRGNGDGSFADAVPLAALYVLVRDEAVADGANVRRLSAAAALTAVLAHAYCFSLQDVERKGRMMTQYLELVSRVPVYEVRYGTGLDRVPAILDAIERTFDVAPAPAVAGGEAAR
ncbi:MAG TPA: hypothetical protein VFJ74_06785 [Gemmatimonadaceae bacterium]|nr:hypothetical protein [Gemmatimonadaceae bacterium]